MPAFAATALAVTCDSGLPRGQRVSQGEPGEEPVTADLAGQLRVICLALTEVTERPSHGAPTWFVRGKSAFVTLWPAGHHDHGFPHLWCAGPAGAQHELLPTGPSRFFRPTNAGHRGWIGVRFDRDLDWAGDGCDSGGPGPGEAHGRAQG